jgi:hypothetical protein
MPPEPSNPWRRLDERMGTKKPGSPRNYWPNTVACLAIPTKCNDSTNFVSKTKIAQMCCFLLVCEQFASLQYRLERYPNEYLTIKKTAKLITVK